MAAPPKSTTEAFETGIAAEVPAKAVAKPVTPPKALPAGEVTAKAASPEVSVAPKRAAAKPKAAADTGSGKTTALVAAAPGTGPAPAPALPPLRRKDIVDHVTVATGARRKHVKQIVSHTLEVLGNLIARGEQAALHALLRTKSKATAAVNGSGAADGKAAPESGAPKAGKAGRRAAKPLAEPAAES